MLPIRSWHVLLVLAGAVLLGGCSARSSSSVVATGHHDPGVRLTPDPANATARIAVVFEDTRMQMANCSYRWSRNGSVIAEAGTAELDPSQFSKNDMISVAIGVPDPASGAVKTLNADVRIVNSPPRITRAGLVISAGPSAPAFTTRIECVDPDGDLPTYTYRWFKNGNLIAGAADATLPLTRISRGDHVSVEVVAHDDVSASAPMRSDPLSMDNRPPVFSSQPPLLRANDVEYQYTATATDPDGDALHYELVSGPGGMSVDPSGGVHWTLPTGDAHQGDFAVRLSAIDSKGGQATQDFTIHLDPLTSGMSQGVTPTARPAQATPAMQPTQSTPSSEPMQPTPAKNSATNRYFPRHSYFADTTGGH